MAVSSSTLFHFTKSRSNLEKILAERFKVTYCKETFKLGEMSSGNLYVPMISFCDLPIGLIKDHISKYGNFAIGMTKEWGIKNQLNPVLYLEKNSAISRDFFEYLKQFGKILDSVEKVALVKTGDNEKMLKETIVGLKETLFTHRNLYTFIKNYEGELTRDNKKYPNYRFYDEREWRFVPPGEAGVNWGMSDDEYKKFRGSSKSKNFLEEPILDFSADDIRYLIVKKDSDIPPLIRKIRSIDHLSKNPDQADILITKIMTVDSIHKDH
jgi:hypothetical protein